MGALEKNRKILSKLRLKTCFQQDGRVRAQKLKKCKSLCVNSTFAISKTEITLVQSILELLWDSDVHFSSYKAVN